MMVFEIFSASAISVMDFLSPAGWERCSQDHALFAAHHDNALCFPAVISARFPLAVSGRSCCIEANPALRPHAPTNAANINSISGTTYFRG